MRSRRPQGLSARALVALALSAGALVACAGESGPADEAGQPVAEPTTTAERSSPPSTAATVIDAVDGVRAAVERSRLLSAQRMFELIVMNDGAAGRHLTAYRLDSPLFAMIAPHERDVTLRTGGARISVPLPYGEPVCSTKERLAPSTMTLVVDGVELRLTIDDAPLRQQHEAECAQKRVEAAVSLRFGDEWASDEPGTLVGEVMIDQRLDGVSAVVEEIAGTVVLSLGFDRPVGAELRVDDEHRRGRIGVVVSVSGCSAHALIESKKTYRFPAWVSLDGEAPVRVEMEPIGEARRAMEALLADCQP